ncbi:Spore protease GPR related protein [Candidatus Syntrophocurvum alkaliphilum]|uniref:Spore protease GPR related protein n=1 Tax=Candidatus Syntrophocurvum alkaliphilum TaxID=2293317 RepID=A0A6I6DL91_9FIRM|nr:spore protease YyaC [Candidatus Syntrophocurvum alkaliphilum]QGU00627.1 Spore protease GPR related protein [Candidatus Syntrophocurvum alkaliphilum]
MNILKSLASTDNKYSYHYDDPLCFYKVQNSICQMIDDLDKNYYREIVYVCIGTDRATGDCLGPLVGTRIETLLPKVSVFGTLEKPTHALNLNEVLDEVNSKHNQPLVIAIDASLGSKERIGYINIKKGSLKPGTALNKTLPEVGDCNISGVVNVGGFLEQMVLQNTRLHIVYKMANVISRGIFLAHNRIYSANN